MIPRVKSSGRFSECQTSLMMCVSQPMILLPLALSISDVILQMSGARLFFSSCTAFFTSSTVIGSVEHCRDGSAAWEEASRSQSRLTGGVGANYWNVPSMERCSRSHNCEWTRYIQRKANRYVGKMIVTNVWSTMHRIIVWVFELLRNLSSQMSR